MQTRSPLRRPAQSLAFAVLATLALAGPAHAGPPYATDDPAPTDLGRWEIFNFVGGSHVSGSTAGEGGFDINYGAARDLQLTLVIPAAYEHDTSTRLGMGTVEIAAKYRFLHQAAGGIDLAFFPRAFAPTAPERFGTGRWGLLLPLWAGKDFGPWQVFGGGGYQFNPGPRQRGFWTGGVAVQRAVTDRLSLGAEVYHHSADEIGGRDFTGLNVGMTYKLVEHWSLLASGGPGIRNAADGGRYAFYVSLKADY